MRTLLVMVVVLVACKSGSDESRIERARIQVKNIALEAYPRWSLANSSSPCPRDIGELFEFGGGDSADPWGQPLKLTCGASNPPEVKTGIGVVSFGPDKREGTADDIASWK